jgi:hypothetical protein
MNERRDSLRKAILSALPIDHDDHSTVVRVVLNEQTDTRRVVWGRPEQLADEILAAVETVLSPLGREDPETGEPLPAGVEGVPLGHRAEPGRCPSTHPDHGRCWDLVGHYTWNGQDGERHYIAPCDEYGDEWPSYWTDEDLTEIAARAAQPAEPKCLCGKTFPTQDELDAHVEANEESDDAARWQPDAAADEPVHLHGHTYREGLGYLADDPDCAKCCALATEAAGYVSVLTPDAEAVAAAMLQPDLPSLPADVGPHETAAPDAAEAVA